MLGEGRMITDIRASVYSSLLNLKSQCSKMTNVLFGNDVAFAVILFIYFILFYFEIFGVYRRRLDSVPYR